MNFLLWFKKKIEQGYKRQFNLFHVMFQSLFAFIQNPSVFEK